MSPQALIIGATQRQLVSESEGVARYRGRLSSQWNHGQVPNGGYSLATALHCAQDFVERKRGKENADLFLSTASYHSKVSADLPYTVEVRILKSGRGTTNVESDLLQPSGASTDDLQLKVRVQLLFANFIQLRSDTSMTERFTISNDGPFAPRFPFLADPKDREGLRRWYKPHSHPLIRVDKAAEERAKEHGELVAAVYMYMPEEEVEAADVARHNITAIALYSDMTARPQSMMPDSMMKAHRDLMNLWFPTMSLSIEMREPMPRFPLQKVASIARTKHLSHGQWRFEVEIWSHPDDAERLHLPKGTSSTLLAVGHQTALTYSMAINKAKSSKM